MKVSCTVWSGGKSGDYFKGLPIAIFTFRIPKYDRYDPCVKAMMVEYYADSNSMIKVGKILGERIYSSFSLDYIRKEFSIPRQTIFNTLKKMPVIDSPLTPREATPSYLDIMADEKFVPLQSHKEVDGALVAEKTNDKGSCYL